MISYISIYIRYSTLPHLQDGVANPEMVYWGWGDLHVCEVNEVFLLILGYDINSTIN